MSSSFATRSSAVHWARIPAWASWKSSKVMSSARAASLMARGKSTSLWTAALAEGCRGDAREDEVENDLVEREKAEKDRRMTGDEHQHIV